MEEIPDMQIACVSNCLGGGGGTMHWTLIVLHKLSVSKLW